MDISVRVARYHEVQGAIFYELVVTSHMMGVQWQLDKRYSHFDTLHAQLQANFPNVPPLPPKTLLKTTDAEYLKYRMEQLQRFLIELCRREDLVRSEEVRLFLDVGTHVPEAIVQSPSLVLEEQIAKPIRAAYLAPDLLIYTQYEHISMYRVDAYISKIRIPFVTQEKEYVCYTFLYTRTGTVLTPKWRTAHDNQATAMTYSPQLGLILVGFDSGQIHGFLINSEEPVMTLKTHTLPVHGLAFSDDSTQVISVGDDKRLVVMELNTRTALFDISLSDKPLQLLRWGQQLVVPQSQDMSLYRFTDSGPSLSSTVSPSTALYFSHVQISENAAFIGSKSGQILVYQLDKQKETGCFQWQGEIRAIVQSIRRQELMVGNDAGKIATFSLKSGQILNVFSGDFQKISYLGWDEAEQLLFVSGHERKLRAYRMPETWQMIVAESLTDTVDETIRKNAPVTDDLEGWDR